MSTFLRKILQPFFILYAVILFLTGLVISCLLTFIIGLRNTHSSRLVSFGVLKCWSRVTLLLAGMPVKVTGKPNGGRYIVVANHISYIDAANLFSARPDYFHALGKIEMSTIPLFGFLYRQVVILVDRSSTESRSKSMLSMRHFLNESGNIFIFPEGTFNETGQPLKEFYDGAFRLAISTQTAILPLIFPDAKDRLPYKGWWTIWPGKNRAIYLDPVNVAGLTLDDVPKLKQQVYSLMEAALVKHTSS